MDRSAYYSMCREMLPYLAMSNVELTASGVKAKLASEVPEPLYSETLQFVSKMSMKFDLGVKLP